MARDNSWGGPRLAREAQFGDADFVAPEKRSFRVPRLEGDPAVVAGTKDAKEAELARRGERPRHDVRILAIPALSSVAGGRDVSGLDVYSYSGIRAGALDPEQLAEVPVAGNKDHAFDALAHEPIGERAPLVRETATVLRTGWRDSRTACRPRRS